ncbi:MAG: asparagine synthase (glutamine-hydrolyzing) [Candidatus Pacebacteria bacterium]|nr:asparagine synthase (glutamine-hydrolyzing) [Candidatus Paceibacterota bacterium]
MCGITGIYNLNGNSVNRDTIKKMTDLIAHRGPDGEGFYVKKNIGFGHRRLAIIDLSETGHQPMHNEDGSIWITYNGEIYNYIELRKELRQKGHIFKSETDTEVIIHAYEQWGEKCLDKFNGMFAFAIWDEKKEQLFCARDRFGIKPFYYFFDGKRFVFASEIKAIISLPFFKKEPNEKLIYDYLTFGVLDHTDKTFFKNVNHLKSSHYLILGKNRFKIKRYYQLPLNTKLGKFKEEKCQEYSQRFLELFEDSVKLRLRSDVSVGSCLSGGLDSSSIVCIADKIFRGKEFDKNTIEKRQKTFSSCFEDERFDERKYIQEIVKNTKVQKNFVFPSGEKLWTEIDNLIWHQEEPFGSTSIYAQWNVMKAAKENNTKVLLDGQGGDELLAGYLPYFGPYLNQLLINGRFFRLFDEILKAKDNSQQSFKKLAFYPLKGMGMFLPHFFRLFLRKRMLQELNFINADFADLYKERENINVKKGNRINLQKMLWENGVNIGLKSLLRYEDKNSMAFSVETRLPFLDYRVVEYAFSLPACYKIHDGWTKYLLRVNSKNPIPEKIRWRRDKMGFVTPEIIWLRNNKSRIKEIFKSKDFRSNDYVDQKLILDKIDNFLYNKDVGVSELWRFINLELWLKRFF